MLTKRLASFRFSFVTAMVIFCTALPFPYIFSVLITDGLLIDHYLIKPFVNSFLTVALLIVITSVFCIIWAYPAAIFLTFYHFRYKKILVSALILPIAIPSYLTAYIYSDLLYYTGNLAIFYQKLTGNLIPFNIRSCFGAGFVLSLSLYPYLFFPLYLRLQKFPTSILETAQTVGHKKIKIFLKTLLPSTYPISVFSLALIALETLGDYGTVSYYGVITPVIFLFNIWQQTADITVTLKITIIFFMITAGIFYCSYQFQRKKNYALSANDKPMKLLKFKSLSQKIFIYLWLISIFFLSFIVPVLYFLYHSVLTPQSHSIALVQLFINSMIPAFLAAVLCLCVATILSYYTYHYKSKIITPLIQICTSGYAFPSIILGISLYTILLLVYKKTGLITLFGGSLYYGSLIALILCYYIKFLTVSYGCLSPVYQTINPSLLEMSRLTGRSLLQINRVVYLPFFTKPMLSAFILVFVDVLKELPATLMLRPFNFETFATDVYNMAGLERIDQASVSALILISTGVLSALIPIRNQILKAD